MTATAVQAAMTLEGFLLWEDGQKERWERVGGAVRMMAGGTAAHDTIANNVRAALQRVLRGSPCRRHGPDLKVVTPAGDVLYPDAFVSCGERRDGATWRDAPTIVFEVLSPATMKHDLTRKKLAYQSVPSLGLIVYVSVDEPRLDLVRRREDGLWQDVAAVQGLDGTLDLPGLERALTMAEIYEDTALADEVAAG